MTEVEPLFRAIHQAECELDHAFPLIASATLEERHEALQLLREVIGTAQMLAGRLLPPDERCRHQLMMSDCSVCYLREIGVA